MDKIPWSACDELSPDAVCRLFNEYDDANMNAGAADASPAFTNHDANRFASEYSAENVILGDTPLSTNDFLEFSLAGLRWLDKEFPCDDASTNGGGADASPAPNGPGRQLHFS